MTIKIYNDSMVVLGDSLYRVNFTSDEHLKQILTFVIQNNNYNRVVTSLKSYDYNRRSFHIENIDKYENESGEDSISLEVLDKNQYKILSSVLKENNYSLKSDELKRVLK